MIDVSLSHCKLNDSSWPYNCHILCMKDLTLSPFKLVKSKENDIGSWHYLVPPCHVPIITNECNTLGGIDPLLILLSCVVGSHKI